jgi:Cell shape-determining protein
LYPKGLLIGRVVSIHKDEGGLLKAAWIEPAARLNKVEEVFILTDVDHSEGLKNE